MSKDKDQTQQVPAAPAAPNQGPAGEPDKANSTKTVMVGCKLPNGLLCELGKLGDPGYRSVLLNGSNAKLEDVAGGFGLTPNVSEDFIRAWLKKHAHFEMVKKALIFIHQDRASAVDYAKDNAELKTGLEPLDPDSPPIDPITGKPAIEVDREHFNLGRRELGAVMNRMR